MTKKPTEKSPQPTRVEQNRARTRKEILVTAQHILMDRGVEAVTLASVSGEMGLTKQALYHYFPSKEALIRCLVTALLDDEIDSLLNAIDETDTGSHTLGTMIRAFYDYYIGNLNAFRAIYCQSQLYSAGELVLDAETLRNKVNVRTRMLFDILEERISTGSMSASERAELRRLTFTAWLAALGLLTMLSVADATKDPLIHSDTDLLATLTKVFDEAASC
jgi:AcrR family transcriptional regulator